MKPLKLTLSAFGSYGGTEVVDFEATEAAFFSSPGTPERERPRFLTPLRSVFLTRPAAERGTAR